MDEFDLIRKYLVPISSIESQFLSNDGAVFKPKNKIDYVVSTDTIVEKIHFKGNESPDLIAKKALRTNLSDLAAMGADPEFYSLSISLPRKKAKSFIKNFAKGLKEDQNKYNIKLLGGDLTGSSGLITITINIIGTVPRGKSISRSKSMANDLLYVTGILGLSHIGLLNLDKNDNKFTKAKLKYYLPQPRLNFSASVRNFVTSMIDISDGLIQDCKHLAKMSNLEFVINLENLPISNIDLLSYEERLNSALIGGDDYELLFTSPPAFKQEINKIANAQGLQVTNIGYVKSGKNGEVTSNN
ncbi:thiamine-phosphate kinase, partial [Alphaproteobacteria bacterium]|nr:thiamine-phosphate kinase [Alphaproteobacteria bacterium]